MRRSNRRGVHKRDKIEKGARLLFILGVIIAVACLIFYKFYVQRPVKIERIGKKAIVYPKAPAPPPLRIAIILDDFGYNNKNVDAVFNLKRPVTFSILPHHAYSKLISMRAYQNKYEAILHLPLEPHEEDKSVKPESQTIRVGMKKDEVLEKLNSALENVLFVKGISNHQGSKATEDAALIETIFSELKKRNMFFVDSLVTNKSVCKQVAKEIGIKFAKRDIFLDNKEDFEYIRGQMHYLVKKAKKKGFAIGIGHDRTPTISALEKLMPEAEKEGIRFVFVSELIQ